MTVNPLAGGTRRSGGPVRRIGDHPPPAAAGQQKGDFQRCEHSHRTARGQCENLLVALRSLFRHCTKTRTIFRNPTMRIKVGQRVYGVLQPLHPDGPQQGWDDSETESVQDSLNRFGDSGATLLGRPGVSQNAFASDQAHQFVDLYDYVRAIRICCGASQLQG
jgi:hypothetical protein